MILLFSAAAILLILGFFKPQASLFWYNKQRTTALSSIVYGALLVFLIYFMAPADKGTAVTNESSLQAIGSETTVPKINSIPTAIATTEEDAAEIEEERITRKLKSKAGKNWPNDYATQEYWINQELEDYKYMSTVPNGPIKRQAERDWPYDYSTQKYWYDQQVEARERLNIK